MRASLLGSAAPQIEFGSTEFSCSANQSVIENALDDDLEDMGMDANTSEMAKSLQIRRGQAERSETMQRRLLDAAIALLHERGLAQIRMADVAEHAGVSKGALLHHFPTKMSLIVAVFHRLYQEATDNSRAFHPTATLGETISDLISDRRAFFFSDSYYITLDIAIAASRDPALGSAIFDEVRLFRDQTDAAWVKRLTAFGVLPERVYDAIGLVDSTVRGLAVRAIWEPDQPLFQRLQQVTTAMIMEHFCKPADNAQAVK